MSRKDVSDITIKTIGSFDKRQVTNNKQLVTDSAAGFPPFLRGNSSMMYLLKSWKSNYDAEDLIEISITTLEKETIEINIAKTLIAGLNVINSKLKAGFLIDEIAPKLVFKWMATTNHFENITRVKVSRILWAKLMASFNPKNQQSLQLKSYYSLNTSSENNSLDTITRKTIQALSGVFAGVELLDTQNQTYISDFLQYETHITKTIDPWAGSFELEKQTEDLANSVWKTLQEKLNQESNES